MTVVLLGPQHVEVDAGRVLDGLGVRGRVALVTAGWQEREADDEALVDALGVPAVNLRLHARSEAVFESDVEFAVAYKERQELLRQMQELYRVRLDHISDAAHAISLRHVQPELLAQEGEASVEEFRHLDGRHLARCRAIHARFEERWRPGERASVARHRRELRALVEGVAAVVIAGGHVASLLNRLKLFDVVDIASGKPLVAWSAGAMALAERIVLFHDFPPYGKDIAQVLDAGTGLVPGLVVLPDPRRRLRLDDRAGLARFVKRMAPSTCVVMDHGAIVVLEGDRIVRARACRLTPAGDAEPGWTG